MPGQPKSLWSEIIVTVNPATWRDLLHDLNQIVLDNDRIEKCLPADLVESGWLGRPKARANIIAAAEHRLGRPLPPSYREFLAESNGWQCFNWTGMALLPAGQINWLRDVDPSLIKIYDETAGDLSRKPVPSDVDYAASYHECQGWVRFQRQHMHHMLTLSNRGRTNADYIWLNPHAIFPDGEWEAWKFAPGEGQGSCYRSFWDLMVANLRTQIHDHLSL